MSASLPGKRVRRTTVLEAQTSPYLVREIVEWLAL
jgi:hypothetical protein